MLLTVVVSLVLELWSEGSSIQLSSAAVESHSVPVGASCIGGEGRREGGREGGRKRGSETEEGGKEMEGQVGDEGGREGKGERYDTG